MKAIVHICQKNFWIEALELGEYRAKSLAEEGYIHCSTPVQVLEVANTFYAGFPDLVLIWIDTGKLAAELKWEETGEDVFPHLYGPLNLEAVMAVSDFEPNSDGVFRNLPNRKGDGIND